MYWKDIRTSDVSIDRPKTEFLLADTSLCDSSAFKIYNYFIHIPVGLSVPLPSSVPAFSEAQNFIPRIPTAYFTKPASRWRINVMWWGGQIWHFASQFSFILFLISSYPQLPIRRMGEGGSLKSKFMYISSSPLPHFSSFHYTSLFLPLETFTTPKHL